MNRTAAVAAVAAVIAIAAPTAVLAARNPAGSAQAIHPIPPSMRLAFPLRSQTAQPPADPNSFAESPPPPEASPAPKPEEWKDAPKVRLAHDVDACNAFRVREWIKIHCAGLPLAGVSLLAGTRAGVSLWVDPPKDDAETMKTLRTVEVIFPVRRGDGRLFQVGQFGEGYDGPVSWNVALAASEQWIEGERTPIIGVR